MKKDDIALPFLDGYGRIIHAVQFLGERGHFVVVRRKKSAAAVHIVKMFKCRPSNRETIIGRGAAPDLV